MKTYFLPFLLSMTLLVANSAINSASGQTVANMKEAADHIAAKVANYLENAPEEGGRIAVGTFVSSTVVAGNNTNGAGISKAIKDALLANKSVKVVDSGLTLSGTFDGAERDGKVIMVVEAKITKPFKGEQGSFTVSIDSTEDAISALSPPSADFSEAAADASSDQPGNDVPVPVGPKKQTERLADAIINPKVNEKNNVFFTKSGGVYGIEILLLQSDKLVPCPVLENSKVGKVGVKPSETYVIRIHNNTSENIGVILTIDGVNMFAFSKNPGFQSLGKVICRPGANDIKGWHSDNTVSHPFSVGNYGDSAAGELGVVEGVGAISATFVELLDSPKSDQFGTIVDREKTVVSTFSTVPAAFGQPVGTVSVRYIQPVDPSDLPESIE